MAHQYCINLQENWQTFKDSGMKNKIVKQREDEDKKEGL